MAGCTHMHISAPLFFLALVSYVDARECIVSDGECVADQLEGDDVAVSLLQRSASMSSHAEGHPHFKHPDRRNPSSIESDPEMIISRATGCQLPSNAKWCTVKPLTGPNFDMAVYASDDQVSDMICKAGMWETNDPAHFGTAAGNALDIGGNLGYYTFFLANQGWNVNTFEPMQTNLDLIHATMCRNPSFASRITIHSIGLGAENEDCVLISGETNVGDGTVKCGAEATKWKTSATPVQAGYQLRSSFSMKRLDDILILPDVPKTIDFVKLDVEGFECQVLKGAGSLLTDIRPKLIQSEVWPQMSGCTSASYLDMYKAANYKVSKATGCPNEDSTLTGKIEDFYMCPRGQLWWQIR